MCFSSFGTMPGCARSSSLFLHLIVTVVRLARPGGLRSVVAELLLDLLFRSMVGTRVLTQSLA